MTRKLTYEELEQQLRTLERENSKIIELHRKLAGSEKLHRIILENISDAVLVADDHGKINFVCPNTHNIFGLSQDEVYGLGTIQKLLGGSVCDPSELKHKNELRNIEWSIKDKSGNDRILLINAKSINIIENAVLYVMRDITERESSQKALFKNEEQFRFITENIADIVWILDLDFKTVYVSPSIRNILGFTPEERLEQKIEDMITSESLKQLMAIFFEELASKKKNEKDNRYRNVEVQYYHKNGSKIWMEIAVKWISDASDNVIGILGVSRDINQRKLAEEALRKSEALYHSLFENAQDAIFVADPATGILLDLNQSAEALTGYSKSELIGKHQTFIHPPEDTDLYRKEFQKSAENEGAKFKEMLIRTREGQDVPVEISSGGTIDVNNQKLHIGIFRNITKWKQAEKSRQDGEARYRKIVETAPYGIQLTDLDGKIVFSSRAHHKIQGYADGELVGKYIWDLMADSTHISRAKAYYQKLINEQPPPKIFFNRDRTADGREIDVQINWDYLFDSNGHIEGIISIISDITDQKLLESRLQQAQRLESIGTLAGGIAHDFNNILYPIIGLSELLLEDLAPGGPEHENAREILRAGKRGRDLVQQILAFSRQSEHKLAPVRVQQILKEAIDLGRSIIPVNIEIVQEIQSDCGLVTADPTQVHQVAMNLITNAYQAVESTGGRISVRLREVELVPDDVGGGVLAAGRYVLLSVSDTGCGMEAGVKDKIFEPYFTTKVQGKGTGLGLAVVYGIVHAHKGDIRVESEPGRGTTFQVYLPVMEKFSGAAAAEKVEAFPTGSERILLVDDEAAIVRVEKQLLERLGYRVTARMSSVEALEAFRAQPDAFDLVMTDMTMPGMTGDELVKEVLWIRPDMPVIICTGFSDRMSLDKAAAMGIRGFLMKPIVGSDLAGTVRNVLDQTKDRTSDVMK